MRDAVLELYSFHQHPEANMVFTSATAEVCKMIIENPDMEWLFFMPCIVSDQRKSTGLITVDIAEKSVHFERLPNLSELNTSAGHLV
jgi:hypothetical protein